MKQLLLVLISVLTISLSADANSLNHQNMSLLSTLEFNQLEFPTNQYVPEVHIKNQIVLHHTASGKGVNGDYRHWLNDPKRIATCVIVDSEGVVNQLFNSKYWGYHLGIKAQVFKNRNIPYQRLDKTSIGLEIDNWGGLKFIDNEWRAYPNKYGTGNLTNRHGNKIKVVLDEKNLVFYKNGFRGYEAFERYSNKELDTTAVLLKYWSNHYNIPIDYNSDIWDVTYRALRGEAGLFTHVSYRSDKSDCHPQKELIQMLKSLT
jgi:hypothetical protein